MNYGPDTLLRQKEKELVKKLVELGYNEIYPNHFALYNPNDSEELIGTVIINNEIKGE